MPTAATPPAPRRPRPRLPRRLAQRMQAEAGFTLIEVLASAVIVTVMALGVLGGIDETTRSSYNIRLHTDAQTLAQQDQNKLRGLNIDELKDLNQTLGPYTLDGVPYTVNEQATYVTNTTGSVDCNHPSADYIKLTSTVTWTNMGARAPVVINSFVTPPIGSVSANKGGLAVDTNGAGGAGIQGLTVTASGPVSETATTDANGCVIWGDLPAGTYTVTAAGFAGTYVDQYTATTVGPSTPDTATVSVTGGTTASQTFNVAPAGSIAVSFASTVGTPGAIGVIAQNTTMEPNHLRECALADVSGCPVINNGDTSFPASDWPQVAGVSTVGATWLYPFNATSTPAGNYAVYAGTCSTNEPSLQGATDVTVQVTAGSATSATVTVPPLLVHVFTGTSGAPGSETMPTHVYIRDTGCNVRYQGYLLGGAQPATPSGQTPQLATVPIRTTYPAVTANGLLAYPGMPFGNYEVCVDNGTGLGKTYWGAPATIGAAGATVNLYEGSGTVGAQTSGAQSTELGTGATQC